MDTVSSFSDCIKQVEIGSSALALSVLTRQLGINQHLSLIDSPYTDNLTLKRWEEVAIRSKTSFRTNYPSRSEIVTFIKDNGIDEYGTLIKRKRRRRSN
jgi:hypothetical protein